MDAAVVGGGAVGITAAHDLAARGVDVSLFERDDLAAGSTGRAAGICYDAFAEDVDARVSDRAMVRFREFREAGLPFEDVPYLWLAREGDDRRAKAIREQVERMRENDRDVSLLGPEEVRDRFPSVQAADVAVAAVAENAGCTDPGAYVDLLADRARERGVRIETGVEAVVDPPRVNGNRFDAVLVAAGASTPRLVADAGIDVAAKPYRVQALTARTDAALPTVYDATGGFYCRPHPTGLLAGDGTEEVEADPADWDRTADADFLETMADRLDRRLTDGFEIERSWAGLCTATPDRNPLVGELREGLYVATGFQGHGFMRAPALGERIAEEMTGGDGIEPFDPARFDGDEEFEIVEGMTVD